MLTKEEADELINHLWSGHSVEWNERARAWINKFTEKPIREIQVGDIYRDLEGMLREITTEDVEQTGSCMIVMSKCGYLYRKSNGIYLGDCEMPNLDMSACYQLVECEDVD